jgi:hypothetical protein
VTQPITTFFLGAFNHSMTQVTVAARAVAGGDQTSPDCVCLEATSGQSLVMGNGSSISAPNMGVSVDSSSSNAVLITQGANLNAMALGVASTTWNNSGNVGSNITQGGTISSSTKQIDGIAPCAPTWTAPVLPPGITCYANPVDGYIASNNYTGVYTLPLAGETAVNNTICYNGMDTSDAASVTFTPGYIYYINGNLSDGGGAPVTGNGVEFYVTGNVNLGNGVTTNLSPTTVNGVQQPVIYAAGTSVTIAGGNNSNFNGVVYAPNAAILLDNGTSTNANLGIVGQSLTMEGGGKLSCTTNQGLGTLNMSSAKVVE